MPEHIDMAPVDTLDVDIVNTLLAVELVDVALVVYTTAFACFAFADIDDKLAVELVDIVPVDTLAIDIVNTLLVAEYIEPVAGNVLVSVAVDIHIADNVVAALPD